MKHSFHWQSRSQKRCYDSSAKANRVAFARRVLSLSRAQLQERLSFAMDGVVLGMPPPSRIDRWNHCKYGETHIWRQQGEATTPAFRRQ